MSLDNFKNLSSVKYCRTLSVREVAISVENNDLPIQILFKKKFKKFSTILSKKKPITSSYKENSNAKASDTENWTPDCLKF